MGLVGAMNVSGRAGPCRSVRRSQQPAHLAPARCTAARALSMRPTAVTKSPSLASRFQGTPITVCSRAPRVSPYGRGQPYIVASLSQGSDGSPVVTAAVANADAPTDMSILETPLESRADLVRGRLDNGLEYVIVPNKSPPNRFEAHLQMHVGSVDEKEDQQGISHIVEHVTFLGSRKREQLLNTGARSNAFTDFHHTVFHVHAPLMHQQTGQPLLPQVIEALTEVAFYPEFLRMRIEKERKAVLAEAQMMNTIEYRIDCQLLRYLHSENALAYRFPIGLVDQIKSWQKEEMLNYWKKWYFPANATLYLVGDFDGAEGVQYAQECIQRSMGRVPRGVDEGGNTKQRHPVRPPVQHVHGCGPLRPEETLPREVSMFKHPLVSNFILSMFAKLPIHAMDSLLHVKEVLVHRILVSVYQRRIGNRYTGDDASFHSIELEISDSGREGACVCTLSVTSEPKDWEGAVRVAVQEAKRMQQHGVTQGELDRYLEALLKDGAQLAASADSQPHSEVLDFVMESITTGQCINSNTQSYESMLDVAQTISLDDVNRTARSYLSFAANYGREAEALADADANPSQYYEPGPVRPTCIVASVPAFTAATGEALSGGFTGGAAASSMTTGEHVDGTDLNLDEVVQPGMELEEFDLPPGSVPFDCSDADIQKALMQQYDMEPLEDIEVPKTFITDDQLASLLDTHKPEFVPLPHREALGPLPPPEASTGVVQRRLSNGVSLNYKVTGNDPSAAMLRLCASGGRAAEPTSGAGPAGVGAMQAAMRSISEAGTVGDFQREAVELFCLSRLINCMIDTDSENMFIDFHFASDPDGVNAVFQLVHMMVEHPKWDERAFSRAKVAIESNFRGVSKSLERNSFDRILSGIFGPDRRFREPNVEEVNALTLEGVSDMLRTFLRSDNIEVNVVGDFDADGLEKAFCNYMGTIAPRDSPSPLPHAPIQFHNPPFEERHQVWHLDDSVERAIGNVAGVGYRRWGALDGTGPVAALTAPVQPPPVVSPSATATEIALAQSLRRAHPLFATTTLLMLQDIINSRLWISVRDQLNLTYDVSCELNQFDRLNASWWCVSVTATPAKIVAATQASLDVMRDMKVNRVTYSEVERTKQTLLTRHESDLENNLYVLNLVTHLQAADVPQKTVDGLRDLPAMIRAMTVADLNDAFNQFGLNDDEVLTLMGTSGPVPPEVTPKLKMQSEGGSPKLKANAGEQPPLTDMLMAALAAAVQQRIGDKEEKKP